MFQNADKIRKIQFIVETAWKPSIGSIFLRILFSFFFFFVIYIIIHMWIPELEIDEKRRWRICRLVTFSANLLFYRSIRFYGFFFWTFSFFTDQPFSFSFFTVYLREGESKNYTLVCFGWFDKLSCISIQWTVFFFLFFFFVRYWHKIVLNGLMNLEERFRRYFTLYLMERINIYLLLYDILRVTRVLYVFTNTQCRESRNEWFRVSRYNAKLRRLEIIVNYVLKLTYE